MQLKKKKKKFDELTAPELYAIIQLRNEVFVVEQHCVYQDADGKDPACWHLAAWQKEDLIAYTRIIPPGISYKEASIGRVVSRLQYRNTGIGKILIQQSIHHCFMQFDCSRIKIGAQVYLTGFYNSFGFTACSSQYLEDGIPHVEMVLNK